MDNIRIVTFEARYARAFADLNYQWIEQYFAIEEHDTEQLDDPSEQIIGRGGQIFFAIANEAPVGTVALINTSDEEFELAKMAVAPEHRGKGIGDKIILAAIEFARKKGKRRIYLLSNTKLTPAIALYRKHGFLETSRGETSPYERVDIRMELAINPAKL